MRFTEIGQQLRAYRLESGLRAEEIAARLGVSRAALYRYEKGEVIKLDTIQRLAELLKISPLSLLGIGVEYYSRAIGFYERLRQIEETADQILLLGGPLCYLTASDAFDTTLADVYQEQIDRADGENGAARAMADQLAGIQAARRRMYAIRRPNIIAILPLGTIAQMLETGIAPDAQVSERQRRQCKAVATAEIEHIARIMESEPIGLQFGVVAAPTPSSSFGVFRARDRATLAVNPFPADASPTALVGVAMITSAEEAIAAHQRVAEAMWQEAIKGPAGAARLRRLLGSAA
jgi:transcriptional regulator with XRE-family HTH domain